MKFKVGQKVRLNKVQLEIFINQSPFERQLFKEWYQKNKYKIFTISEISNFIHLKNDNHSWDEIDLLPVIPYKKIIRGILDEK